MVVLDRWSSDTVTVVWELAWVAWVDTALVVIVVLQRWLYKQVSLYLADFTNNVGF